MRKDLKAVMRPRRAIVLVGAVLAGTTGCGQGEKRAEPVDPDQVIVPEETADEAALRVLSRWEELPVLGSGVYRMQSSEDRMTGEPPPVALTANGNRDMNNFVCKSPDAELEEPSMIPVTLDEGICPESYVRGFVMARFEGSGRLARIWMTALSLQSGPPDREVLRIYVDDHPRPLIQVPLAAALDGSAGEMFAPPFGACAVGYLAWYYPVVFGSKLITTVDRLDPLDLYYHQTVAVLDPEPQPRRAADSRLDARDDAAALLGADAPTGGTEVAEDVTLLPQTPAVALDVAGPATVQSLSVRIAEDRLADLAAVRAAIRWDDAVDPAVDVLLDELFAASMAPPQTGSLALAASRAAGVVELKLRLPMPFESRALWVLTNESQSTVELRAAAEIEDGVPAGRFGRFYVQRFETASAAPDTRHPLASVPGPGRLCGVCLMMEGHELDGAGFFASPFNFLEGDELGVIDGVRAVAGTGTEDYLNGAFYFEQGPASTPFAQWWGIEVDDQVVPPMGRVTACRWHVLGDAVDFQSSLELNLEIGPGDPSVLDRYRSVAYLYR